MIEPIISDEVRKVFKCPVCGTVFDDGNDEEREYDYRKHSEWCTQERMDRMRSLVGSWFIIRRPAMFYGLFGEEDVDLVIGFATGIEDSYLVARCVTANPTTVIPKFGNGRNDHLTVLERNIDHIEPCTEARAREVWDEQRVRAVHDLAEMYDRRFERIKEADE